MVHVRHILLQSTRKAPHGAIGFTDVVVAINEDVEVFEGFGIKNQKRSNTVMKFLSIAHKISLYFLKNNEIIFELVNS